MTKTIYKFYEDLWNRCALTIKCWKTNIYFIQIIKLIPLTWMKEKTVLCIFWNKFIKIRMLYFKIWRKKIVTTQRRQIYFYFFVVLLCIIFQTKFRHNSAPEYFCFLNTFFNNFSNRSVLWIYKRRQQREANESEIILGFTIGLYSNMFIFSYIIFLIKIITNRVKRSLRIRLKKMVIVRIRIPACVAAYP